MKKIAITIGDPSGVGAEIILDWVFAIAFTVAGLLVFLVITLVREKLKTLHKKVQETR